MCRASPPRASAARQVLPPRLRAPHRGSRVLPKLLGFAARQPVPLPRAGGREARFILRINRLERWAKHRFEALLGSERKKRDFREMTFIPPEQRRGEGRGRRNPGAGEGRHARAFRRREEDPSVGGGSVLPSRCNFTCFTTGRRGCCRRFSGFPIAASRPHVSVPPQ